MRIYVGQWTTQAGQVSCWTRMCGAAVAICLLISSGVQADTVSYALSIEFSGATPPEGASPWLTATLNDGGTPGSVDLSLATTNLTDNEFVFEWLFNLDPALTLGNLVFSAPVVVTGTFTNPTINTGIDAFMANGDGLFDIQVMFDNTDGAPNRFGAGDAVKYTITSSDAITASSFDFLSAMGGGAGVFPSAAHVGGIGPTDDESGWVSIPEPSTALLIAVGVFGVAARRRRN